MAVDLDKLKDISAQLRELVGPHGAYILYVNAVEAEFSEDTQIRTLGPPTKLMGMLSICTELAQAELVKRVDGNVEDKG